MKLPSKIAPLKVPAVLSKFSTFSTGRCQGVRAARRGPVLVVVLFSWQSGDIGISISNR
ncbi:hypothetical protein [Tistrella mobilis]|uniref:hypothetical protein n=1 Tax=Tistrella mobilis TaxID=171437 RepID=UPI003555F691